MLWRRSTLRGHPRIIPAHATAPGNLVAADYRPALLTMVGVLAVGFVANLLIRPVDESHFDDEAHADNEKRITTRMEATR